MCWAWTVATAACLVGSQPAGELGKENGRKTPEEIGRAILTDPDPVLV